MRAPLQFKAGRAAIELIEREGLQPENVAAIAGAAGGPKWLVLAAMDKFLFGEWLKRREAPLPLVGSSIGSWRLAAVSTADPIAAINRLERLYVEQCYSGKPSLREVTDTATRLLDALLGEQGTKEILAHPWARLHVVTAACRGWTGLDKTLPMALGFAGALLLNTVKRDWLSVFLERHVFADPRGGLAESAFPGFKTNILPLTDSNLQQSLLASGSIPFVLEAISMPGQAGRYRDGGLIDYHMDLPLSQEGVVLMPHFSKTLLPGWLDKYIGSRGMSNGANTLVIHPSDEWIATLPNQKIPDRTDFKSYRDDDVGRFRDWYNVAGRSQELADFLEERLLKQDLPDFIEPL
ncbi:hypothetical protein FHR99_000887 [Litorivivens lipolytica]|uniref:Uncharacterized protein n=1 Tax=Litorivivens lipolytica TaxID=1524264 RepID=A0A7W4Z682_9GAMM|nr:patatin-like phospholipase family protein [Litorivivens lipolytica]MBB3046651.1 hypothetical protein [Litorivivens lipolytica]